jgi:hypothetical protein
MLHEDADVNSYRQDIGQIMDRSLPPDKSAAFIVEWRHRMEKSRAQYHVWHRSSRSVNNQSCVELRGTLDQVRDSKNAAGPMLRVKRARSPARPPDRRLRPLRPSGNRIVTQRI